VKVARAKGYFPPLCWDDIDDPDEKPQRGKHEPVSATERIEELRELGVTDVNRIAERLRIQPRSVERQLYPSRQKGKAA
jgi:hypothetical protein